MSFDYVMEIVCIQTITILYKYFYIWELDLRLNNINYYQFSSIIISYYYWHLWGRDGIVKEPPIYVYYAYLKPIWDYRFNSLVILYVG